MDLQPLESARYYWTRSPPPPPAAYNEIVSRLFLVLRRARTRLERRQEFSQRLRSLSSLASSRGRIFFFLFFFFFRFHSSLEPATFDELSPAPR